MKVTILREKTLLNRIDRFNDLFLEWTITMISTILPLKINSKFKGLYHFEVIFTIVLYCIDGVVIAAQCTVTFSDHLYSPVYRYY